MNKKLDTFYLYLLLFMTYNCITMEWKGETHKPIQDLELKEKTQPSPQWVDPEKEPLLPPSAPEISVALEPQKPDYSSPNLPPISPEIAPAAEQPYSFMGKTIQDKFNSIAAKINRLKGQLSSSMLKKWNDLALKMKNVLQDINKQKNFSSETVRLLPQEIREADERLRQAKTFNPERFADDLQEKTETKTRKLFDEWLDSPSYQQAITANRAQWPQLIIDYPHQAYSEDPVIKQFVNSPAFQDAMLQQISSHLQNQQLVAPDQLRADPTVKEIINQLSAIGFIEGKITAIESILTTPDKRNNYVPSQIKKLQEDLKGYNSQLLTSYQQLRNRLKSWGNSLKTTTLQKRTQETNALNNLAHDYQELRSHYSDLFEQLDQFNNILNEETIPASR